MSFQSWRQIAFISAALLVLVFVLLAGIRFLSTSADKNSDSPFLPSVKQDLEAFFQSYWQRPIPLQGPAPASFSDKEASLDPEACGSCHVQQYSDWKESLHARAMGPGVWGQIIDFEKTKPDQAVLCMTCHAPLSEQMPMLEAASRDGRKEHTKNPHFDAELQLRGITCAACHVRQQQRFGPPKAEGAAATQYAHNLPNHGGVQRTPYFEKAEFCKDCHQFDPENTVLVNGKPMQDTYREWKNSTWGQGGASCQECHMPGRRHLWRGIHDREWVREGVRVEAKLARTNLRPGGPLEVTVEVASTAVGHKFPTYVTPKVFVRAAILDGSGQMMPGSQQETIIGWDVRFENGEWKEYFDSRIPPGETAQHTFRWTWPRRAGKVRAWVEVHPDHFYHVHFYPAYLTGTNLSPSGRKLVERALQESGRTPYVLYEKVLPLD